jgi:hypothetical protein
MGELVKLDRGEHTAFGVGRGEYDDENLWSVSMWIEAGPYYVRLRRRRPGGWLWAVYLTAADDRAVERSERIYPTRHEARAAAWAALIAVRDKAQGASERRKGPA